ncbi:MAG: hypothetical protein ACRC7H_03010 [Plesiomonas shigelloides]
MAFPPCVPRFIEPKQRTSFADKALELAQMVERSLSMRQVAVMTHAFSALVAFEATFVRHSASYAACLGSPLQKKVFLLIPAHMFSHEKP